MSNKDIEEKKDFELKMLEIEDHLDSKTDNLHELNPIDETEVVKSYVAYYEAWETNNVVVDPEEGGLIQNSENDTQSSQVNKYSFYQHYQKKLQILIAFLLVFILILSSVFYLNWNRYQSLTELADDTLLLLQNGDYYPVLNGAESTHKASLNLRSEKRRQRNLDKVSNEVTPVVSISESSLKALDDLSTIDLDGVFSSDLTTSTDTLPTTETVTTMFEELPELKKDFRLMLNINPPIGALFELNLTEGSLNDTSQESSEITLNSSDAIVDLNHSEKDMNLSFNISSDESHATQSIKMLESNSKKIFNRNYPMISTLLKNSSFFAESKFFSSQIVYTIEHPDISSFFLIHKVDDFEQADEANIVFSTWLVANIHSLPKLKKTITVTYLKENGNYDFSKETQDQFATFLFSLLGDTQEARAPWLNLLPQDLYEVALEEKKKNLETESTFGSIFPSETDLSIESIEHTEHTDTVSSFSIQSTNVLNPDSPDFPNFNTSGSITNYYGGNETTFTATQNHIARQTFQRRSQTTYVVVREPEWKINAGYRLEIGKKDIADYVPKQPFAANELSQQSYADELRIKSGTGDFQQALNLERSLKRAYGDRYNFLLNQVLATKAKRESLALRKQESLKTQPIQIVTPNAFGDLTETIQTSSSNVSTPIIDTPTPTPKQELVVGLDYLRLDLNATEAYNAYVLSYQLEYGMWGTEANYIELGTVLLDKVTADLLPFSNHEAHLNFNAPVLASRIQNLQNNWAYRLDPSKLSTYESLLEDPQEDLVEQIKKDFKVFDEKKPAEIVFYNLLKGGTMSENTNFFIDAQGQAKIVVPTLFYSPNGDSKLVWHLVSLGYVKTY